MQTLNLFSKLEKLNILHNIKLTTMFEISSYGNEYEKLEKCLKNAIKFQSLAIKFFLRLSVVEIWKSKP